jgi:hypothetical protein
MLELSLGKPETENEIGAIWTEIGNWQSAMENDLWVFLE